MKQKNYIIKLLLKTWLGILCFSLLCTFCAVWLLVTILFSALTRMFPKPTFAP